jgi:hypothetical protein
MKRYLGIVLAIVFVTVVVYLASSKFSEKTKEAAREASASKLKSDYLERVAWIRSNPDEKSYKDEVTTFLRWYFNQVNEHVNKYGGDREFDGYLAELDKKAEKGGKEAQLADKKAYFEYTKAAFDQFRKGKYEPQWTGTDKGMRLDIVSTKPVKVMGEDQIRYEMVLWGAQREMREDGKVKKMSTSASFNVTWKLYDEKDKLIGEMSAAGDPKMKVDWPERFIPEFPPMVVLGYYDIDLFPAETKRVEITFAINSHAPSGGDINSHLEWKLDAPAEWKLSAGQAWKGATESTRPEDEIDPVKRAAAQKEMAKTGK